MGMYINMKKKTLIKSITYRLIAVCTALTITMMFGLNVFKSLSLTITINVIHTIVFYWHERVWKWYFRRKYNKRGK